MSRCSFLPRSVPAKDTPTVRGERGDPWERRRRSAILLFVLNAQACMTFFDEMGLIKKWRISSEVLAK